MKSSIIKEIFSGNRGNQETISMLAQCDKLRKETEKIDNELKQKLDSEAFALCKQQIEKIWEFQANEADFYFTEGFKLGLRIGIECMDE